MAEHCSKRIFHNSRTVAEWEKYEYNESSQLIAEELYNGKKTTKLAYEYNADKLLMAAAYDGDGDS